MGPPFAWLRAKDCWLCTLGGFELNAVACPAAQPRTILGKYDEEAGAAMQLDEAGSLNAAKLAQQEEVRRRLKASLSGLPGGAKEQSASTVLGTQADFLSPEEVVQFAAPKKLRKKKKLRERVDMTDLEATIAAVGALPGDELGSRRSAQETAATARCASTAPFVRLGLRRC